MEIIMHILKDEFFAACAKQEIEVNKAEAIWHSLAEAHSERPQFQFSHLIYYLGALIVLASLTFFIGLSWEWFGGGGIFLISMLYILGFVFLGNYFWHKGLRIAGGLLITLAVGVVPLAIYGLETYFDVWPTTEPGPYEDFYTRIKGSWVFLELGTILAGLVALYFYPFPFLTFPIFFAAWFLTMDAVPLLVGEEYTFEQYRNLSLYFGMALLGISFILDRIKREDYAFWGYLFGTITFWMSLTAIMWDTEETVFFGYFLINLAMMVLSVILLRRVLVVFGGFGVFIYLSHLAYNVFEDSIWFPFVLSFFGLAIIYLGVLYQRHIGKLEKAARDKLPWLHK